MKRKINWLSSLEERNKNLINGLESKLQNFYSTNQEYYNTIDFTSDSWIDKEELGFKDIVDVAKTAGEILEVGCGSANILKHYGYLQTRYHGCDFSGGLLSNNSIKFPCASFRTLKKPNSLPYENNVFDLVFSVYVIEHTTNPSLFLNECIRVLKQNGILIILCPDFLGQGRMTSQRAGFSAGTTTDKLKKKKYFDALITYYDNHVKIPFFCKYLSCKARNKPRFFINIAPTIFTDKFFPDVDAVYVTSRKEMILYLQKETTLIKNPPELKKYETRRKLIYLKLKKGIY